MNSPHIRTSYQLLIPTLSVILLLSSILLLLSSSFLYASDTDIEKPPHKKVLILHSYHKGLSWTDGIEEGIRNDLSKLSGISIFTEYLDSKRQDLATAEGPFGRYLRAKYLDSHFDLIIVSDNNALTFLRSEPVEDFIGVPIIFCGINNFSPKMLEGLTQNISGTVERIDPGGTVRIIRKIQPATKRLFIISDASPSGIHTADQTKQDLDALQPELEITWWNNLTTQDLLTKLSTLTKEDAILLLVFNRDASGTYYSYEESARLITSATKAPVYGLWDFYLETGVVGGRMVSSQAQGKTAAILALRYFKTGNMPKIITTSPNASLFNQKALTTHGINPARLPADAILTRTQHNFQNQQFLAIGGAILTAIFVIMLLFILHPLVSKKTQLIAIINRNVLGIASCFILCIFLISITGRYIEYKQSVSIRYQQLIDTRKQILVMKVEQAVHLIQHERKLNTLPLKSLQKNLLQQISAFSFQDGAGYLFVLDYHANMLFHYSTPTLVGKNTSAVKDPTGIHPALEIIHLAKESGNGFISYLWPKPNSNQPTEKLTYVVGIQDWEWAIACGLYLDDIALLVDQEKLEQRRFFLQELAFLLFTSILGLTFLYLISRRLSRRITDEIISLEEGLQDQDEESDKLSKERYQIHEFKQIATGIQSAFTDLSVANAELQTNEKSFLEAVYSSPDAITLIDKESFIACNQSAAAMLGYNTPEQLLNIHPSEISPTYQPDGQDSVSKADKMIAITIAQGTNRFEWQHLKRDSTPIPIEVTLTLSPVTVSNSNTVLQCVWRDLSHEKEVTEQMHLVEQQRKTTFKESERMNRLMSGREERIIEIKEEVNNLLVELGREAKYGRNKHSMVEDSSSLNSQEGKP